MQYTDLVQNGKSLSEAYIGYLCQSIQEWIK